MLCLATYRAYWRQDKYITEVQIEVYIAPLKVLIYLQRCRKSLIKPQNKFISVNI